MVHALEEAWRVLKPAGVIIDLRPISVDTPLLIKTRSEWKLAGMPDQSPDRVHDLAVDRALREVTRNGLFIRRRQRYFDVYHYWNSLEELEMDLEERWKDDIIVSKEIWRQARSLYNIESDEMRIRFLFRKKIVTYQKITIDK